MESEMKCNVLSLCAAWHLRHLTAGLHQYGLQGSHATITGVLIQSLLPASYTQRCTSCKLKSGDGHPYRAEHAGLRTLGPAVQYLPGELRVEAGTVLPLLASHNTVRMRFDVEAAEYLNLARTDASFPPVQFAMLADEQRNEVRLTQGSAMSDAMLELDTRIPS